LSPTLVIEAAARTDIGRVRETNQDALLVREDLGLFVVADGMGGHAAGEVASFLATRAIEGFLEDPDATWPRDAPGSAEDPQALLVAAVLHANRRVYDGATRDRTLRGMGTTVVAALARGGALCLAHLGDSRVYRLRNREIEQLTDDHTIRNEWIKQGMAVELANNLRIGRNLARALGTRPTVQVSARLETVLPGDVLLLCSDGVHGVLTPGELTGILLELGDLWLGVERLIAGSNERGGPDNSTALLMRWSL
jgi:protein phosphatase